MAKLPKELEQAILNLSEKDKDKLLIKLVSKNELLSQQLYFQLLEDESDLKVKRNDIKEKILKVSKMYHDTAGWMMMDMRELNSKITHHVKVTKDKFGEIELTIYLLNTFFDNQLALLEHYTGKTETIAIYIAKRTEFVLKKLEKIHEDYFVEFERDMNKLLSRVHKYCPAYQAKLLKIPSSWND